MRGLAFGHYAVESVGLCIILRMRPKDKSLYLVFPITEF